MDGAINVRILRINHKNKNIYSVLVLKLYEILLFTNAY